MAEAMSNVSAAATLRLLADLLAIRGDSVYKVSAYRRAAESIEALGESLSALRQRGALQFLSSFGIHPHAGEHISQPLVRGRFHWIDQVLLAELLRGLLQLVLR